MGSPLSKPFKDLTKEEVADLIAEFGEYYKPYAGLFTDHGIDGGFLDSLDEKGIQETFDDLGISNRLHRRVLQRLLANTKIAESFGRSSPRNSKRKAESPPLHVYKEDSPSQDAALHNRETLSFNKKRIQELSSVIKYGGSAQPSPTGGSTNISNDVVLIKKAIQLSQGHDALDFSHQQNSFSESKNSTSGHTVTALELPIFKSLLNNEEDRSHLSSNFYDTLDALKAPRPPIAKNDLERSAAVEALCLTDISPSDDIAYHLETIVKMATEVFGFPYGEITFHNHEFQFRIASYCDGENPFGALNAAYQPISSKPNGKPFLCKTGRGASLCNYTIAAGHTFVIQDVTADNAFAWLNTLIPVRCYVGSPIKDSAGRVIADLCMFDTRPRPDFEASRQLEIEQFSSIIAQSIESWAMARAIERLELERNLTAQGRNKSAPPKGNVALVVTDIQESTALWESDPMAMRVALGLHDSIMRRHCAEHWGYEIETEGDSFVLAFHDPVDAVAFALGAQVALFEADWPLDILRLPQAKSEAGAFRGLRVRMAIHQGHVVGTDESGRISYVGETMKLTRNLSSLAHGGQILTTYETWDVASYFMGKKLGYPQVVDLGTHVLQKGKTMRDGMILKRITQLVPCELAYDYFAARQLASPNDKVVRAQPVGRQFPLVTSCKHVSPSFHNAPYENNEVTVAFVNMSLVDDRHVMTLESTICSLLDGCRPFDGYSCGREMLVFRRPLDAILFGLLLQKELSYRAAQDDMVDFAHLIKYGCIHGTYLTMGPHRKTGRADYFGQIVNRAARVSSSASAGSVCLGVVVACEEKKDQEGIAVSPIQHPSIASRFCGRKLLRGIEKEFDVFEFTYAREMQAKG